VRVTVSTTAVNNRDSARERLRKRKRVKRPRIRRERMDAGTHKELIRINRRSAKTVAGTHTAHKKSTDKPGSTSSLVNKRNKAV
jgi:hypothetical protein